jgi:hypothetical protein
MFASDLSSNGFDYAPGRDQLDLAQPAHVTMLTVSALGPWWVSLKSGAKEMGLLGRIPLYSLASGIVILAGLAREIIVASTFGLSGDLDVLVAVMGFHLLLGVQAGNAIQQVFVSKLASQDRRCLKPLIKRAALVLLSIKCGRSRRAGSRIGARASMDFPGIHRRTARDRNPFDTPPALPDRLRRIGGDFAGRPLYYGSFYYRFFFGGAIVSVSTIASVLVFADRWGIDALVWGFAAGHFLVLAWFAFALWRSPVSPSSAMVEEQDRRVEVSELWRPTLIVLFGEFLFRRSS